MMIAPRWRKVLRDIWANRVRTLLIVLTIATGAFAIGTIGAAALTLQQQLPAQYQAIAPANLIFTTSPFDAGLVNSITSIEGVTGAEARRSLPVRLLDDAATGAWRDLQLFGIVDFEAQTVNKILPVAGQWPPQRGTLLLERGSLAYLGLADGQTVTIKTPQGKQRTLTISGVAHDLYHMPAFLEGTVYGYVSEDTLRWLGQEVSYNELYVRVENDGRDPATLRAVKDTVKRRLEGEGALIFTSANPSPDGYPMDYIANTLVLLLVLLGCLILLLGVCLVISTMSALVAQQARQIAVIKAVGGRTRQVIGIYMGMVLILGVLSALVAIPLSFIGARELVSFVSGMLNFDARLEQFPVAVIALQVGLAVLLPLAAALVPVWASARRSPALALSEYGQSRVWAGVRWVDGILSALRGLTRLERLALRNPFRNRKRLAFSLIMLALAGGSFISVMNLQTSLRQTVASMLNFWQYDFWVTFNQSYLTERLEREAARVPGISAVEGWGFEMSRRVRADGSESNPIFLFGTPPESAMVRPAVLRGRWLATGDENTLVVGAGLLDVEPDLDVGKTVVLKVNGKEQTFTVVGVIEMMGNQTIGYLAYTSMETYTRLSHQENRANMVVVRTTGQTVEQRLAMGTAVESAYKDAGLQLTSVMQMDDERMETNSSFGILVALLLLMVGLLALVGGLGLMGTMSLNVLERSREIGVIRAFGGSNRSVFQIVVLEGVAIGVMSWFFGLILAAPLTWVFCDLIGRSFMSMGLSYHYSPAGAALWLALVVLLAALSSLLPAANAVRLTVREVLSYE